MNRYSMERTAKAQTVCALVPMGRVSGCRAAAHAGRWAEKCLMNLAVTISSLVAAVTQCCLGQSDTNTIAVGDWSAPVRDGICTLRGRLVVYAPEPQTEQEKEMGLWQGARVFLELQRLRYTLNEPVEIFIDRYLPMHAEMHDGQGHVIADERLWHPMDGPIPLGTR